MSNGRSLRNLTGLDGRPSRLANSTLILIDCQETYVRGALELDGVSAALDEAAALLERARTAEIPVIHVVHDAGIDSLYDIHGQTGQIVGPVKPLTGEPVVVKNYPNAFVATELDARLRRQGDQRELILAGFMTHMCVSSTARGAFSLGHRPVVIGNATATRQLQGPDGTPVSSEALQSASLAAIGDLFGNVVSTHEMIPD